MDCHEDFREVEEELDDYEDIKDLRDAKAKEVDATTTTLDSVRKELGV